MIEASFGSILLNKNEVAIPLITECVESFCAVDDAFTSPVDKYFQGTTTGVTCSTIFPSYSLKHILQR